MLHTLGKKVTSEDLVDLLLACHQRIRMFLALAVQIGERTDASDADVVDASAIVHRYFVQALPLHVADEEEGVASRLHGRSTEVDVALDRMCEEHDSHMDGLRRLRDACLEVQVRPAERHFRMAVALAAHKLSEHFEPHLQAEERIVFPAIRQLLTADEQQAVVRELRLRRQAP